MASIMSTSKRKVDLFVPVTSKRRKVSSLSAFHHLTRAQYTGHGFVRISQLPETIRNKVDEVLDLQNVPKYLSQLDSMSVDLRYDDITALPLLRHIYTTMVNFEARRSHDAFREDSYQKFARLLINHGAAEVMLRLLMQSSVYAPNASAVKDSDLRLRTKSIVIQILIRFTSVRPEGEKLCHEMVKDKLTFPVLLELLSSPFTASTAVQLMEDLLQAMPNVLNLSTLSNLTEVIPGLDDQRLANFCRILSVTISDLDIYENKSSLFAQNKQKRTKGFVNVRDINQELLLNIPDLLPRLVKIATAKEYTPRFREKVSELDNWMEWIEHAMSEDAFENATEDALENFVGGICEPTALNGVFQKQSGLEISNTLVLKVQVVYVLGLFLVGKHRKKVQRKLAELELVPGLSELFDNFIWKCQSHNNPNPNNLRGHRTICECSPEVALKIQFLRLVHSFCDHSEFKHLLLSRTELNELTRLNRKVDDEYKVDCLDNVNRALMCRGSKGLLTKIVDVMKKEPTASTFRFWLARAVESYLRGSTSHCDQVFLLRRGLLQHIAGNIVENDIRPKEILQSSFDLLGELIKFNMESFKHFDLVFTTNEKFEKFLKVVNKNLVDSNMFIRSLILSYEHLCDLDRSNSGACEVNSLLLRHIGEFDQQMFYLRKLISLINVENLTQENVSCLNTTLVFLMFGNQRGQLPRYLKALMQGAPPTGGVSGAECAHSGTSLMKTFRDLLLFWQDHYLHKDKDCSSLEKSSRISFAYWKETVHAMVSDDSSKATSVLHYMEFEDGCRDN